MTKCFRIAAAILFVLGGSDLVHAQGAGAEWESLLQKSKELQEQEQIEQAIAVADRALELAEKTVGAEHPDVATTLTRLAVLHTLQDVDGNEGAHVLADACFTRSLSIWEELLGRDHTKVSVYGNHLESFYRTMEWFYPRKLTRDEADFLYKRLDIALEASLGPNAPELATNLDHHARLYLPRFLEGDAITEGDCHQAESLFRRSLVIREKALGPEHLDVAESLDNLASLYKRQREYAKVEPLYRRALAIREMAPEPNDWQLFLSLGNLTSLYQEQGEYGKLEPLYLRGVAIYEKRLAECGPDSALLPRVFLASTLDNLAKLYRATSREQDALELETRAEKLLSDPYGRRTNGK